MVFVAVKGKDTLVNDNYYKDGLAINQKLEQDQLADELNLRPFVSVDAQGLVLLRFDGGAPDAPFLKLKLVHPTVGEQDIIIQLLPTDQGYMGNLPPQLSGRWYLDLYANDESWRIREEVSLPLVERQLNAL